MKWARSALCVVTVAAAVEASAVEVALHNGKRYAGDVRLDAKTVFVRMGRTTYKIPRGSVKAIVLSGAEQFEYERRKALAGTSAQAHFDLARWLESRFQYAEAERFYELTLQLDPDFEGAREALGYERENGQWTRTDEARWRIRSRWLGPEAADACVELAKIYQAAKDDRRVESFLRQALIANPYQREALTLIRPFTDKYVSRNLYRLPVEGTWAVINDHNQHHRSAAFMQYGLDFMKLDDDLRFTKVPTPTRVEDYYTWDAPIHAAADGEVYSVNDGFPDSPLGTSGEFWSANTVCIRHAYGEYTVYGHLKNGSIAVKAGDPVKAGDVIAHGGNSGSSGWPHMHWAMYDRDGISLPPTFVDYSEADRAGEKKIESGRLSENHIYRNLFGEKP